MNLRKPTTRWALWVFAAALLLKSAMPLLADASASTQGRAVFEVCSVYGVAMLHEGGAVLPGSSHVPDPLADHHDQQCALNALGVLADAPHALTTTAFALPLATAPPSVDVHVAAHDACAAWIAGLKHGPPAFA
jgi:hypothetical protein